MRKVGEIKTIDVDRWGVAWINGERRDGLGRPLRFNHRNRWKRGDDGRVDHKRTRRERQVWKALERKAWLVGWRKVTERGAYARRLVFFDAAEKHRNRRLLRSVSSYKRCLAASLPGYWETTNAPTEREWFWGHIRTSMNGQLDPSLCLHCDGIGRGKIREHDCPHGLPF